MPARARVGTCYHRITSRADLVEHELLWTSAGNGQVRFTVEGLAGVLWWATAIPVDATAGYDVRLTDARGADMLLGRLMDRSATAAELVYIYDAANNLTYTPVSGLHTLEIDNAGASKSGIVIIALKYGVESPYAQTLRP